MMRHVSVAMAPPEAVSGTHPAHAETVKSAFCAFTVFFCGNSIEHTRHTTTFRGPPLELGIAAQVVTQETR